MPITINGSGTVTGISAGGLPDDCITTAEIAAAAVTTAKLGTSEASGLAKAWVNFNGTGTVAIRASFNVSSITDNSAGNYTINLTTAVPDTNGVITFGKANQVTNNGNATGAGWQTTSSINVVNYEGGNVVDGADLYFAIFR